MLLLLERNDELGFSGFFQRIEVLLDGRREVEIYGGRVKETAQMAEEFLRRLNRINDVVDAIMQRRDHAIHKAHRFHIHCGFDSAFGEQYQKLPHGLMKRGVAFR